MKRASPPPSRPAQPGTPPRAPALATQLAACADAVAAVRQGQSLQDALGRCDAGLRPGVQALSFTVMRELGVAQGLMRLLVPRPPAPWVEGLLLTALALLTTPAYAPHTLVDQAVESCKRRARPASGLVNAVLRRVLREQEALIAEARSRDPGRHNHPAWWVRRLQQDWPDHWEALLAWNQRTPPMTLRVNRRHQSAPAYAERLREAGWTDLPSPVADAIVLPRPCPVDALPGWAQGDVSVQDWAAQQAAPLLVQPGVLPPLHAGARVLDACAAPGGKTAHLLELADLDVLALDIDGVRAQRITDTLERLKLDAQVSTGDGARPETWWDGRPFEAILLDAPCSASGIVRRHPDVRWLRRETDIAALARTQDALLDALWPLLTPGGRLLYCTCSVFRAEGEDRIDAFLQRHPEARRHAAPGHMLPVVEYPDAPQADRGDAFFYALLTKPA
ncbi:16S rRNA (cytosine(967)-C(5))-methyltransferase RsmB [Aquabacterium fontiphilum]|uniref:16S rRNA (cytosine(967)-C(5))-methyltransferase RsmB n=1 Tax=Aquabacterium fontiphilum TaxID=450365 RepID=UPI00137736D2|nr:16S rRNA (cytosine(967)-C(5))-methyltransferase RsmB [Aquabacterium fontiphilum]NBD19584.1 16S rRNA (cytosine(967)-C(5))-methyltransferase RsmB [Aquabacterium fontiphilum]